MAALSESFWSSLAEETDSSLPISLEEEFLLVEKSTPKWDGLLEFIEGQTIKGGTDVSQSADNQMLMRFPSQTIWDESRVVLSTEDPSAPNFINASHLTLPQVQREYILTESPLLSTISNFWQMVWQFKIGSVVMLSAFNATESGANQIHAYMPTGAENGDTDVIQFGDFVITHESRESFPSYDVTHLRIAEKDTEISRSITHYAFSSWDQDTYTSSRCDDLMGFIFHLYSRGFASNPDQSTTSPSPVLVHCSDGIGRSGAFVLLEYCLQIAMRTRSVKAIKIPELVTELRGHRRGVITSGDQLKTVYTCLISAVDKLLSPLPAIASLTALENRESDDESVDLERQQTQDVESSDEDFELIPQPHYSSSDVGQESEHVSSTESAEESRDTFQPELEPQTQQMECDTSGVNPDRFVSPLVPEDSTSLPGEDSHLLTDTTVTPEVGEVLVEESVPGVGVQEETHPPPLSEKFFSMVPEPEPEPEQSQELPSEPLTRGVTKRIPAQEGTNVSPEKTPVLEHPPLMPPAEHSLQSISIFVYLLLPLFVVVVVILVLMCLN